MFWEEKIDQLKKSTDPRDFRVPYSDGSGILKKIEDKFIVTSNSNYRFSNWAERIMSKTIVRNLLASDMTDEFENLAPNKNYWVVLSRDEVGSKNLVYDCKPTVIDKLIKLWGRDFYVVDKKYSWLIYFRYNEGESKSSNPEKMSKNFHGGNSNAYRRNSEEVIRDV